MKHKILKWRFANRGLFTWKPTVHGSKQYFHPLPELGFPEGSCFLESKTWGWLWWCLIAELKYWGQRED